MAYFERGLPGASDYVQMPWGWTVAIVAGCLVAGAAGAALHPAAWVALGFVVPISVSTIVWFARRRGWLSWPVLVPKRRPWTLSLVVLLPVFGVVLWFLRGPVGRQLCITAFLCWGTIVAPQVFGHRHPSR